MIEVQPFRGLRYDLGRVSAGDVIAPPYDIVSPEEHRRYLALSPYNILGITLGDRPGETALPDEDYARRAERLRAWVREGVLVEDREPCFYVYEVRYPAPGDGEGERTFRGLVACVRGDIAFHERVFPKIVDDRYRLLRATRADLGQIFLVTYDPTFRFDHFLEELARAEPVLSAEVKPGEVHRLYRYRADGTIIVSTAFRFLREYVDAVPLAIADGHHRYQTTLRYAEEMESSGDHPALSKAATFRMATIANLRHPGVSLLATHRLLRLPPGGDRSAALRELETRFLPGGDRPDFWVHTPEAPDGIPFRTRVSAYLDEDRRSAAVVMTLHETYLDAASVGGAIEYVKNLRVGVDKLKSGGDLLFRLPAVSVDEFAVAVRDGDVFPQKTTFFYPKLYTGLVMRCLE